MGLFNSNPTTKIPDYETTERYTENPLIRIDLADDDDFYYLYADMPGKKINDIKMKFKGDKLSLRLIEESEDANPISNKSCIIQERVHDETERIITFEEPIDKKKVDARLENGLLTVTIQKINPELEEEEDLIVIKSK